MCQTHISSRQGEASNVAAYVAPSAARNAPYSGHFSWQRERQEIFVMSIELETRRPESLPAFDSNSIPTCKVIRRNGSAVPFEPNKIAVAMTKAFIAAEGATGSESSRIRDVVQRLTAQVVEALLRRLPSGGTVHIENIQDQVELALMRAGEHEAARRYVLYREARAQERREADQQTSAPLIHVTRADGRKEPLNAARLRAVIDEACLGLGDGVSSAVIYNATMSGLYDGISEDDVFRAAILAARALIEREPNYSYATARLLLDQIRHEVLGDAVVSSG